MTSRSRQAFAQRLAMHYDEPGPAALAGLLIRTRAVGGREVLALAASSGALGYDDLIHAVAQHRVRETPATPTLRTQWLLHTAQTVALDGYSRPDQSDALELFDFVRRQHGLKDFTSELGALYAQLLVRHRRSAGVEQILDTLDLPNSYRWSVCVDAINPFAGGREPLAAWLELLNTIFITGGLEPVGLTAGNGTPYDRLDASPSGSVNDSRKVTVVMSAFRPDGSIFAAVNSILRQSWRNLELIVVDDCSPPEYRQVLKEIEGMDERIRMLVPPRNAGTYAARNLALQHASGEFITFQDSDDWSHPRRIELQVGAMRGPGLLATRSLAVRAFPDLTFTYPGYPPDRINASSLLYLREPVQRLLGGFDAVRKSADMEFPERLLAVAPNSLLDMTDAPPLAITQLRHDSLSRLDATPGWLRWSRVAYREAYRLWHKELLGDASDAWLEPHARRSHLPVPAGSFEVEPSVPTTPLQYDVLLVSDWRQGKRRPQHMVAEIMAMHRDGLRVAVVQVESCDPPAKVRQNRATPLQELVNAGHVDVVSLEEPMKADLVLVCDPSTLYLLPTSACAVAARSVALLMSDPLLAGASELLSEGIHTATENAEELFGMPVRWVARDRPAHACLSTHLRADQTPRESLPVVVDAPAFSVRTRRPSPIRPVIGRHGPDRPYAWPHRKRDLLAAYPDDDDFDVRILGGSRTPERVLMHRGLPPNWIVYQDGELSVRSFLAQLDFFVYFDHPEATADVSAEILQAMASGCVVIVPTAFRPRLSEGVLHCEPHEVQGIVKTLHASPEDYVERQRRGARYVASQHPPEDFLRGLKSLLQVG